MRRILITLSFTSALMMAQPPGTGAGAVSQATFTEVKAALTLTDAQVTALTQIRQAEATAIQPITTQLQTKQQALQTSLTAGTTAVAAGTLVLEIEGLRKQIVTIETNARNQATGVLSADQRTKLQALDAAAKLQPAVSQARTLNLLAPSTATSGSNFGGGPGGRGLGGSGGQGFGGRSFGGRPGPPPVE